MSPNIVASVLDKCGVSYERDLNGFTVGNLRLQRGSGIGGLSGDWFIRSVSGPTIRTRSVTSQAKLRTLVCDYLPRRTVRNQVEAFGHKRVEILRTPRRLNPDGTEKKP